MYNNHGHLRKLSPAELCIYFLAGLIFNAFGNGITVATNMGSAPWTASAANLANVTGISISIFLLIYGVIATIVTCILQKAFDWPHIFGNLLFLVAFSSVIGLVSTQFSSLSHLSISWRIVIDFLGIIFIAMGVSITQRLQFILHPMDDLTNLTRFMFFKGNAAISQTFNFSFPMIISLIVWLASDELVALNIGTLFSFFFQGLFVGYSDRFVFSHLDHKFTNMTVSH